MHGDHVLINLGRITPGRQASERKAASCGSFDRAHRRFWTVRTGRGETSCFPTTLGIPASSGNSARRRTHRSLREKFAVGDSKEAGRTRRAAASKNLTAQSSMWSCCVFRKGDVAPVGRVIGNSGKPETWASTRNHYSQTYLPHGFPEGIGRSRATRVPVHAPDLQGARISPSFRSSP